MRFYNSWDNGSKFLDVLFEWQALVAESKREPVQTELAPPRRDDLCVARS